MFGWIKTLISGGGFNKEIAGMNAEQAAAYFAAKKAKEEAAQMGEIRAGTWPEGDLRFTVRNYEQAELRNESEEVSHQIQRIDKHLKEIGDLIDRHEGTSEVMQKLLEQLELSHELMSKFKHELQRLEGLIKTQEEEQTTTIQNAPQPAETAK